MRACPNVSLARAENMYALSSLPQLHARTPEIAPPPSRQPPIQDPANVSLPPTTGPHALPRPYHSLHAPIPQEIVEAPLVPLLLRVRLLPQKPIRHQHGLKGLPHAATALLLLHAAAAPVQAVHREVVAAVAAVAALLHAVGEVEDRFIG